MALLPLNHHPSSHQQKPIPDKLNRALNFPPGYRLKIIAILYVDAYHEHGGNCDGSIA